VARPWCHGDATRRGELLWWGYEDLAAGSQRWCRAVLTRNTVGATPSEQHEWGYGNVEGEDVERVCAVDTGAAGGKSS
jgi:hypothetical protein